MKLRIFWGIVLISLSWSAVTSANAASNLPLTNADTSALQVCEAVLHLFQQYPDSVWPGYNLARSPFVFYMPDDWELLINVDQPADSFLPYPDTWPKIWGSVQWYKGRYANLAGQLEPNLMVDTLRVAAVPYLNKSYVTVFAFLVHELFHDYQSREFGDMGWEREEKYPIEDPENTALAVLEMRSLDEALSAMKQGDKKECVDAFRLFAAVRNFRWNRSPAVARYEQYQELQEGTAKYVEARAVALVKRIRFNSAFTEEARKFFSAFDTVTVYKYLQDDFEQRFSGRCIAPEDMARNRIYPVAAAQGLLLDRLGIEWKRQAQRAGTEFTYIHLFLKNFPMTKNESAGLVTVAKNRYDYDFVRACTDSLIGSYQRGFEEARSRFEGQSGTRFELLVSTRSGIGRSRSSTTKHWVMESGRWELRSKYQIYTLKQQGLFLEIHDRGVLEGNEWGKYLKSAAWFGRDSDLVIDGTSVGSIADTSFDFHELQIQGPGFGLAISSPGKFTKSVGRILIDVSHR